MSDKIITDVSNALGIADGDTSFQTELIIDINTALATLYQAGVGKQLVISTGDETWDDFKDATQTNDMFEMCKQYVVIRTKILFDPPTATTLNVIQGTLTELLYRLKLDYAPDPEVYYGNTTGEEDPEDDL
ncbi:hypothetical protein [Liquorilactobacillus hordei]|uniref:phage head-tail connector protein n=1 Tax=Liquorilactobacillus hordei TaxID=468911 RepID=UPI0039E75D68